MPPSTSFSPPSALMAPAVAAINHLLAQEAWARDALAMHAGKEALIDASTVSLRLRATVDGMVASSTSEEPAHVTIRVKLADLPLIAQNRERAFSYVKIEGDAEFANTISQLAKGLRWEAEYDLERFIGPIGATRLVDGAKSLFQAARTSQQKVAENVAEYFLEEKPLLIRPVMVDDYANAVSKLRDDTERTAKRIARLEQRLAQAPAGDLKATVPGGPESLTPPASPAAQQNLDL